MLDKIKDRFAARRDRKAQDEAQRHEDEVTALARVAADRATARFEGGRVLLDQVSDAERAALARVKADHAADMRNRAILASAVARKGDDYSPTPAAKAAGRKRHARNKVAAASRRINRHNDRGSAGVWLLVGWLVGVVLWLAAITGLVLVVWHFVAKYW